MQANRFRSAMLTLLAATLSASATVRIPAIFHEQIDSSGERSLFWFSVKKRSKSDRKGEFRPAGGDFQGMGIYRSDGWLLGGATHAPPDLEAIVFDESIRLSLG